MSYQRSTLRTHLELCGIYTLEEPANYLHDYLLLEVVLTRVGNIAYVKKHEGHIRPVDIRNILKNFKR